MNVDIEKVVRENIDKTVHLSLATVKDNMPWVCEVHFAYDDNLNLYFRSLPSRRHSMEIAKNPNVAGNIIEQHPLEKYPLGIYFEGTAERLAPGDEQELAAKCMKAKLKKSDEIVEEARNPEGHQFYKISVKNWYVFGKFGGPKGQKYKLAWNGGRS
jgi:uncharacterized protein YhbP (UPF0306 family)